MSIGVPFETTVAGMQIDRCRFEDSLGSSMSPPLTIFCFFLLLGSAFPLSAATPPDPELNAQALAESAVSVQPGVPGRQPFWNKHAVQFSYAPAFDFKPLAKAKNYHFRILTSDGKSLDFTAESPWAPLSAVWAQVPVGKTTLTVEARDAAGVELGLVGSRTFHRAAVFAGNYPAPAQPAKESARTALSALAHSPDLKCWFTDGEPPAVFHLYRYPAKVIGAAAAALAIYGAQQPAPSDAAEALVAARRAADYLLNLREPAGSAWAFHPPTYHPTLYRDRLRAHMGAGHYMTNCGAESGGYFLDVYGATKDSKYLEAAVLIAETYERRQSPEGSWLLFVNPKDGLAATDNTLIPTRIVDFLDHLQKVTGDRRFDGMRNKALQWIMRNPVRTWNWQGQFEDVRPTPAYDNLTKHEACDFAIHLLEQKEINSVDKALALDLLRYAEDQFVMWSQPPTESPLKQSADGAAGAKSQKWLLPCVLEQYRCYAPVCASSSKLILTYLAAWRVTGDRLHLEKARALGATLTRTQGNPKAPGRYQTWVMQSPGPMWFNCELLVIRTMLELAAAEAK